MEMKSFIISTQCIARLREFRHTADGIRVLLPKYLSPKVQCFLVNTFGFLISALLIVRHGKFRHAADCIGVLLPKHLSLEV
jgi:hypothetical protein